MQSNQPIWVDIVGLIAGVVFVIAAALIARYRKSKEGTFMRTIAQTLGFNYQQQGSVAATQVRWLSGQVCDVISGVHNGVATGAFTYRTRSDSKYWAYMTVFETQLPIKLPDIVLQPNLFELPRAAERALSRTTLLGEYELLPLEGNFDKYFTLYVAKGAHIEALELFAPDTMAEMIDHYSSYGLEFSKDTLYLYPMKLIEDNATFMQALALLERLSTHLSTTLSAMATANSVAAEKSLTS